MTLTEQLLLARLCYSHGVDYISDAEYDKLVFQTVSELNPYRYLLSEDIPSSLIESLLGLADGLGVPVRKAVQESALKASQKALEEYTEQTGFDKDKLRSIFPQAVSMQMANDLQVVAQDYLWQIVLMVQDEESIQSIDLHYSYKMDGWNIAVYYDTAAPGAVVEVDGKKLVKICYAHSRGSDGATYTECTAIMELLTPLVPIEVFETGNIIQITGELTMRKSALSVLNKALNRDYANVRNTVSAFVKGTVPLEYSHMVQFNAFKVMKSSGGSLCQSPYDSFCWLHGHGFNVPVGNLISVPKMSTKEETFNALVQSFQNTFANFEGHYVTVVGQEFECDGLTVQPNNYNISEDLRPVAVGNFGYGLLAIKAGIWFKRDYRSEVLQIHFAHSRADRVPKAFVRPVMSDLGQALRTVPLLHTQVIMDNDINIGDTIEFTHHSNQNIEFKRNISAIERAKGVMQT